MRSGMFSWINDLLTRQASHRAGVFASQAAFNAGLMTLIVGAFTAMIMAINAAIEGLGLIMPDFLAIPASWVVPDNFSACVSAYFTGRVAIAAYRWHKVWIAGHSPSPTRYA